MIKISQVKLPVEKICQEAPAYEVKHGIISEEELLCLRREIAGMVHINEELIDGLRVLKRSLDARKKHQMNFVYQAVFSVPNEKKLLRGNAGKKGIVAKYEKTSAHIVRKVAGNDRETRPVVVGTGPAGLFAALTLAEAGLAPVVLERGEDVEKRQELVERFWETGKLAPECNVQFGEGGAGTFSDGKLNTLVKDPTGYGRKVLQTFADFGAPSEILYLQKPHIGTDRLREVVQGMREHIIKLGGEVRFGTRFEKAIWSEAGRLEEILVSSQGDEKVISCRALVLAMGHSARDTVAQLYKDGVMMQPKSFAAGVRVQHPQELIGKNQYGDLYIKLPAADYKLTHQTETSRGVYSFCMCPGGYVVNASSEPGHLVVNGMSDYDRDSSNANSAIVVTVNPGDFGDSSPLGGIEFQRKWEKAAFDAGTGNIPLQLFGDYQSRKVSSSFGKIRPCMKGDYQFADVRGVLPDFIGDAVAEGMLAFDRRIPGFAAEDVLIAGIESRTSSPVRICRDEKLQANVSGIYPCGEGAGYAGGITSAGMDGIRVAEEIIRNQAFS